MYCIDIKSSYFLAVELQVTDVHGTSSQIREEDFPSANSGAKFRIELHRNLVYRDGSSHRLKIRILFVLHVAGSDTLLMVTF